ncbi:MAG: hypothetical protein ACPGXY_00685 [Alphaproteobacteria bacterium]
MIAAKTIKVLLLMVLPILASCTHISQFDKTKEAQLYQHIANELKHQNAVHLKECNCMKAFFRNLFNKPDNTARYAFDRKVGRHATDIATHKDTVNVLAIGSGTLLNELTALSNIIARGKNLNIYITDYAYIFYGVEEFESKAIHLAKHPQDRPVRWNELFVWNTYKKNKKSFLPLFHKHHAAIEEFKALVSRLGKRYGVKTSVTVLKPPKEAPLQLPPLDMIIAVDAYIDVPNLMWNFFYAAQAHDTGAIRFVALNKSKPYGGFWESNKQKEKEKFSLEPVSISVYEVTSNGQEYGSFKSIEHITLEANQKQLLTAPKFDGKPDCDCTQSPLDIN